MQLINVLGQRIVDPVLYGPSTTSTTNFPSALKGRAIRSLTLPCGSYVAYWDGHLAGGREAASGTYGLTLVIDNKDAGTRKIFYKK